MHPGEVLREEFLIPMSLSPGQVAKAIGIPRTRIERIAKETTSITADTAVRLSMFFGTSAEFWINLQSRYDLLMARKQIGKKIKHIEPIATAAA
jgi:addiction module HigA family antidote